jgi:dipeptidyl aminopeptidase/acylaminoacyl peptidase
MKIAPYGSWISPITSEALVSGAVSLSDIVVDGDNIYWNEGRPQESGRRVIMKWSPGDGDATEVNPAPYNARTRVHEYGGAPYTVADGVVFFSNFSDQRVYRQDGPGAEPRPITPAVDLRYADYEVDRSRQRLIAVREDHRADDREAVNTIAAIGLNGESIEDGGQVLVSGNDFYAAPTISPDGAKLAWLTWNHPNMPWDGCELWVGEFDADGAITNANPIAGGDNESIFQPMWSPDGVLHFVSDRTGWWNLYRTHGGAAEPLAPMEAEFGRPLWTLGMSTYGFASATRILTTFTSDGAWKIAELNLNSGTLNVIPTPFNEVADIKVGNGFVAFIAGGATQSMAVYRHDLASGNTVALKQSKEASFDPGYISAPEAVEFPTENGLTAHALFYPPKNKDYEAPEGDLPPLVVISHGGPTGANHSSLDLSIQYWTSRGFAIVNVNYGGSTGYGRAYRERLRDAWGIVDVDDCVNAAKFLATQGKVDPDRLAIRGWSASGYTTLAALTFRDVFKAGASHYGISELEAMATETHKFESRYLDGLIGPYPEGKEIYEQRSPINFVDNLSAPLILFQGLEDKVVPPNQAQMMHDAVKAKGEPVALVMFEGEQHGFRQAKNIRLALDGELYFLCKVFNIPVPADAQPVEIANLN